MVSAALLVMVKRRQEEEEEERRRRAKSKAKRANRRVFFNSEKYPVALLEACGYIVKDIIHGVVICEVRA